MNYIIFCTVLCLFILSIVYWIAHDTIENKLTKEDCDNTKFILAGSYDLYDSKDLYLRVTAAEKYWVYQNHYIGDYPEVSLEEAREYRPMH